MDVLNGQTIATHFMSYSIARSVIRMKDPVVFLLLHGCQHLSIGLFVVLLMVYYFIVFYLLSY